VRLFDWGLSAVISTNVSTDDQFTFCFDLLLELISDLSCHIKEHHNIKCIV